MVFISESELFSKPRLKTIWFFYNYFCQLKFKSFRLKSGARRSLQEGQGFVCSSSFCRDKTVFIQTKRQQLIKLSSIATARLPHIHNGRIEWKWNDNGLFNFISNICFWGYRVEEFQMQPGLYHVLTPNSTTYFLKPLLMLCKWNGMERENDPCHIYSVG